MESQHAVGLSKSISKSKQRQDGRELDADKGKEGNKVVSNLKVMAVKYYQLSADRILDTAKPADFSFKKYTYLQEVSVESARTSRLGHLPTKSDVSGKYLTKALWLNNNRLANFSNLDLFTAAVIDDPSQITWLDLSYNHLTSIDNCIAKFPHLRIVYMHGNRIADIDEIVKLRQLKELRTITFHGNPISEEPKYRLMVINILSQASVVDFAPVLRSERLFPTPRQAIKLIEIEERPVNYPE